MKISPKLPNAKYATLHVCRIQFTYIHTYISYTKLFDGAYNNFYGHKPPFKCLKGSSAPTEVMINLSSSYLLGIVPERAVGNHLQTILCNLGFKELIPIEGFAF